MASPEFKTLSPSYGFDEVSIAPSEVTINPDIVDYSCEIAGFKLKFPIFTAAMDAVVDYDFATKFSKLGGLAVLNLEGIQTRYENPGNYLEQIINCENDQSTCLIQNIYKQKVKEELISQRIIDLKQNGTIAAVSATPANAKRFGQIAKEAGADIFVVQSTVTTARHISFSEHGLIFSEFIKQMAPTPVIVGNTVTYSASKELMETGIAGVIVGIGPGASCTSREVLGIGVPQITATLNCAAARDYHFKKTGKYVSIITDGGIQKGGDLAKAIAAGADAVMIGSLFAGCSEAPGKGYCWGMSTFSALPRGIRIKVGNQTNLNTLLFGPASGSHGEENLIGALKTSMGMAGAINLKELQKSQLVTSPSIKTEGKFYQLSSKN